MQVIDLREVRDEVVIHYGGRLNQVDAYTFANSLISLADSIRAANALVNPGFEIEIAIEALGQGSFRTKLRTTKKALRNIFSMQAAATGLVINLVANQIWQATHPEKPPVIVVTDDSVVFEYHDSKVILPKAAYPGYQQINNSETVNKKISEAFAQLDKDESVTEFGIATEMTSKDLLLHIARDKFPIISGSLSPEQETKDALQEANLQIVRAILEKSNRLWEFVWRGNRISAPVLDVQFYEDLYSRRINLATGDILDVTLKVKQKPIGSTGLFENYGYEVVKIHKHTPKPVQQVIE